MSLEALIKQRIRAQGPMTVAEYMTLALAHPEYGYYMRRDPLGAEGDFITAPEISQIFGELIGVWLAQQWLHMGSPKAALAELGPGRGTLMADALRATKHVAGFHDAVSVHMVETSPVLKQKQQEALAGKHVDIQWHSSFEELPAKPLLLVANEFFDALPIRQFLSSPSPLVGEGRGEGDVSAWLERMVGMDEAGQLRIENRIPSSSPPSLPSPTRGEGEIVETSELSLQIAGAISQHIAAQGGAALVIDYGYTSGTRGDTLQAVKQHHYHEALAEPGNADLTAHVDFAALKQAVTTSGAAAYGPLPQGMFLNRLGAVARLAGLSKNASDAQKSAMLHAYERLTSPDQMGDLFKVLCITHPQHPTPEAF